MLDLTKYTAKTAAKKLYEHLAKRCVAMGQKPDIEMALWSPAEAEKRGYGKAWRVMWEAGPYDWGISVSLGGKIDENDPAPTVKVMGSKRWFTEPHYSFDVGFIED